MNTEPILYFVVPCYNEEETIEYSSKKLLDKLVRLVEGNKISKASKIMFVNDGSRDNTLRLLHKLAEGDSRFAVVSLASNRGHQSALMAGMLTAKQYADIVITIDADLQQDIEAADDFIRKYQSGCDVVYGVRNDRKTDRAFKKWSASVYYKLMRFFGTGVIPNHADYRLMSKRALDCLSEYSESNLFLRGLIPTMGFNSDVVYFDVREREFGTSKYTLKKMMTLAIDGITSLSVKPIRIISAIGAIICLFSLVVAIFTIVEYVKGANVPGYTTNVIISLLLGGVTILSLGVIGEYVAKTYMETKRRPRYTIDSVVIKDTKNRDGE